MKNLDNAFDDFLSTHQEDAIRSIGSHEEKLHGSLVKFGRFTIPTFFKAHFITPEQETKLKRVTALVMSSIEKVVSLYFTDPAIQRMFGLSPLADELTRVDPGYTRAVWIARVDSFLDGDSLKAVEFNCDSPAGMGYADLLEDMLFSSDLFKQFQNHIYFKREQRRKVLLDTLLTAYQEFGGSTSKPNIAIVDWRTVRTMPEFECLRAFFESQGYTAVIADPRDLLFKGGKLYAGEFRIDLLYRRVIVSELLEKADECQDLIKAYKSRAVCVVNPLRSRLAATKSVMSILTNPAYDHLFTDEENEVKTAHIPWTRRILDAEKFYGGRKIYLLDFLKDEKDTLVLKPSEGYGGKDVTIGRETTNEDWNKVIDKALKGDWVVQEYVNIPTMSVPMIVGGKLDFSLKKVNLNPFALASRYAGSLSRLSDESVINVSHGGGLIPALAVEEIHQR